MIVSPTALQKPGADINTKPEGAGAGPFVLSSYKPKDSLTLSRNPSYWGGAVYLDEVKFVFLAGADATYQAFKTGTFNMAFLREPPVIKLAKDDKVPHYEALQYAGSVLWVNHVNSPTSDLRVRQAIAAAIDPAEFNRRVYNGTALTTSSLFSAGFPWDPQVPGHTYDTVRARALVAEAKAAGWDGRLRLDVINTPSTITVGLTLKTMLDVVGMTVDLNSSYDAQTYSVEILGKKNFHLAIGSLNAAGNDGAIFRIIRNLSSTSPTNNISWKSAEVEAAISKLRTASTDDQKKAGYKQVADAFMRDIPAVVLAAVPETIIWNSKVQGVVPTADSIVLLSRAWIAA